MRIIRKKSDLESVYPEYFVEKECSDAKVSQYTHIQQVDSNTFVLFSFVSDAIILLNSNEYKRIQDMNFDNSKELYSSLVNNGIFINSDIDELSLMLKHREMINASTSQTLKVVILPTTACNARCRYCIGHANCVMTMTSETAQKVIDYIVEAAKGYKAIKFDWYGGEPLIKSELISQICKDVSERLPGISYTSVVTTNLLLLDEQLVKTMVDVWHIEKVNVTIDGNEEEHNDRKQYVANSFNGYKHTLNCIDILLNNNIRVFCRYNIDHYNYDQLIEAIHAIKKHVDNKLFYFFISPLRGEDGNGYFSTDEYNCLFYETGKLLNENGIHNPIDSFVPKSVMKFCIAHSDNCVVIGPNGNLYRCNIDEINEDNSTGNIDVGLEKNRAYYEYMDMSLPSMCRSCKYLPICQGGCVEQSKHESSSNRRCDKFIFKLEAVSKLLVEFYSNE